LKESGDEILSLKLNLNISQKGLLLVAVPLAFELFFVAVLVSLHQQAENEVKRELESKTIIEHANSLMVQIINGGTATGEYGFNIKDHPARASAAMVKYGRVRKEALDEFATLEPLTANRPDQAALLKQMSERYADYHDLAMKIYASFEGNEMPAYQRTIFVFKSIRQLNDYLTEITKTMDRFIEAEKKIEKESPIAQAEKRLLTEWALFGGIALNIALAIGLARFFSRDIAQRLNVIDHNTRQLANGLPLKAPVEGSDEIAHVDKVFHEMVDKLKEVDRLKREFVSMVSHDLRSPLTSIQALLSVLEAGILSEEKARARIQDAELDIDRLIKLINDLIEIEKMDMGNLDMTFKETAVERIVKRSINSVHAMADAKKITLAEKEQANSVFADEDRLVQVLVNIISNAIKFSPENSTIEIAAVEAKDAMVEIRVTDHGRGIPEHLKDAIFDRFKQVEQSDAKEKGGSGLGLAICKSIVEGHGGTIGVESENGKGSTFWFKIPASPHAVPAKTAV
jgi:signal transduction histidine kinase